MQEEEKRTSRKPGRRPDSTLEPYAKELIRNAGATKRCEDSQLCARELLGLFLEIVRKYGEPLFWISAPEDSFTSTGLFPEDRYKKEAMDRYTYRLKSIRGTADSKKILGGKVIFERVKYPKNFSLPPVCTIPITEILNRMVVNDPDSSIYLLNKDAYREFITRAKKIIESHVYNTEANRLIRDNYRSIIRDLDKRPEKYDPDRMFLYWEEEGKNAALTLSPYDKTSPKGIGAKAAADNLFNEARREEGTSDPGPVFTI